MSLPQISLQLQPEVVSWITYDMSEDHSGGTVISGAAESTTIQSQGDRLRSVNHVRAYAAGSHPP